MKCRKLARIQAFTLVELLTVFAIIAILAIIALPLYSRFTQQAAQTKTLSNMRVMGTALLLYAGDNNNQLPNRPPNTTDPTQTAPAKWPKLLQPYVQDLTVYSAPIPDVNGKTYRVTDQTRYFDNSTNSTSYIYNGFNDMATLASSGFTPRLNLVARSTSTILLGIPYPQTGQFYMDFSEGHGNNNEILNRSAFPTGSVYVFCDGSARTLAYDSKTDQKSEPSTSGVYSDWYWLMDKSRTSVIQ